MPSEPVSDTTTGSVYRLTLSIVATTLCRLVLNTARRFAYPFAPALSRGLGVPLTAITSLIAINQATAVLGLFFGPIADRLGYRLMMLSGMTLLVTGMFAAGLFPFIWAQVIMVFPQAQKVPPGRATFQFSVSYHSHSMPHAVHR